MERKIIYFKDYHEDAERMGKDELLTFAKNCNDATIYTLEEAFNNNKEICDSGYIYII